MGTVILRIFRSNVFRCRVKSGRSRSMGRGVRFKTFCDVFQESCAEWLEPTHKTKMSICPRFETTGSVIRVGTDPQRDQLKNYLIPAPHMLIINSTCKYDRNDETSYIGVSQRIFVWIGISMVSEATNSTLNRSCALERLTALYLCIFCVWKAWGRSTCNCL